MEDIHSRIKALREAAGFSMEALAKEIGVSWQTIQQWEKHGGTAPKRTRLEAVAAALKTTSSYLLTGEKATYATPVISIEQSAARYRHPDKTIAEIIDILERTDNKGRTMALGAIRVALNGHLPAKANRFN